MFDYTQFTPDDFLRDDWFRAWVLHPDPQTEAFWQDWLRAHPERQEAVAQARALLRALEMPHRTWPEERVEALTERVMARLDDGAEAPVRPLWQRPWLRYAAASVLALGLGWWALRPVSQPSATTSTASAPARPAPALVTVRNDNAAPIAVSLPDGSRVTLQARAELRYAPDFAGTERVTTLRGDAFFDVVKNPKKPFLVRTEGLVTRVLGTSFWVRADPARRQTAVIVRTGRVSVSKVAAAPGRNVPEGVVLTPNQQVVFHQADQHFERSLIEQPRQLQEVPGNREFSYAETPLADVFRDLERAYGVRIVFDEDVLRRCSVTATLGQEPLFDKLTLICRAVRARYEVLDGEIVIHSQGCAY